MSITLKAIPFFSDDIVIIPHTATNAKHIGRKVTIKKFAKNKPVSLSRILENGEYLVETIGGEFIQGEEAK